MMPPNLSKLDTEIDVKEVYKRLEAVIDPHYAKIILGWTLGNFFMDLILERYKVYPFLFFYGSAGSGKSTIANWISSFFGFTIQAIPFGGGTTAVGLMRMANYLSMVPVWIEEYRTNDKDIINKNNMLRNIYDRSTVVKGSRSPDEIRPLTARCTLIISGEEQPRDAALNSRCITVPVYRRESSSTENLDFKWLQEKCPQFNGIGHQIMLNRSQLWSKIDTRIKEYLEGFDVDLQKASSRSKIHISIVGAVCDVFMGQEDAFEQFMGRQAIDRTNFVQSAQALFVFLQDLINMHNLGDIEISHFVRSFQKKNQKRVSFWFSGAYKVWIERYFKQRAEIPIQETMLREHLRHESYFIESAKMRLGVKNQPVHCAVLDFEDQNFPELFKDIVEMSEKTLAGQDDQPLMFGEKNDD